MALVERGQLRLPEAFDDRKDRGVYKADVSVGIAIAEVSNARGVFGAHVLDQVGSSEDIIEQRDEDAAMEPGMDPVVHLHEN
jgi:hypothetical protein